MPDSGYSGCKMQKKIRAVKHWLTQAEQHYGVNSPVRGQMDLLIAEAELKSARDSLESRGSCAGGNWRIQAAALALAAVLMTVGIGKIWWTDESRRHETDKPQPESSSVTTAATSAPVSAIEEKKSAPPLRSTETTAIAGVDATNSVQEVKKAETMTAPQTVLPPEEMKRLVQAAGQTLRGRAKP